MYNALKAALFLPPLFSTHKSSGHLLFCLLSICSLLLLAIESVFPVGNLFHGVWVGLTLSQNWVGKWPRPGHSENQNPFPQDWQTHDLILSGVFLWWNSGCKAGRRQYATPGAILLPTLKRS